MEQSAICFEVDYEAQVEADIDMIVQIDEEITFLKRIYNKYQFEERDALRKETVEGLKELCKQKKELLEKCGIIYL